MSIRTVLRSAILSVALVGTMALAPTNADADLITFTHIGVSGSGSIDGNAFTDKAFSIIATGDTNNRV